MPNTPDTATAAPPDRQLRLADSIFEHSREGILVADPGGFIVDVNPAFERITGYAKARVAVHRHQP